MNETYAWVSGCVCADQHTTRFCGKSQLSDMWQLIVRNNDERKKRFTQKQNFNKVQQRKRNSFHLKIMFFNSPENRRL